MQSQLYSDANSGNLTVRAIRRFPAREALVYGSERYTFEEVGEAVSRLGQLFEANGLRPGMSVALLTSNHPVGVFALAAAQVAGLRYTALHPLGSLDDLAFIIEDAGIDALIVNLDSHGEIGRALSPVPSLSKVFTFSTTGASIAGAVDLAQARNFVPAPLHPESTPDGLCKIFYTGGTTGRPKGVMLTERVWNNNMKQISAEFEWPANVRFLATAPLSHATVGMVPATQVRGGSLILLDGFRAVEFMETVQRERVTATFMVPTMLYALLDHPRIDAYDLSSLELIMIGAAPIAPHRLAQAVARFGQVFVQFYGQTEGGVMSYLCKADHDPARPELLKSCGTPMMGIDLRVLDADHNECPPGEVGELCARGPNVMAGYWNRPDETAVTLREGWLHTGDLATQDERGYLYVVGRAKDMIISGGFNVYPSEIENVLQEHADVTASAIIGIPDDKWGEAVTAFVVLREDARVTSEELRALVRARKGPVYAPKTVHIVTEMPLTPLGKIDKKAIREPFWSSQNREVA